MRGIVGGQSRLITHRCPFLSNVKDTIQFWRFPQVFRSGRITTPLQKPEGVSEASCFSAVPIFHANSYGTSSFLAFHFSLVAVGAAVFSISVATIVQRARGRRVFLLSVDAQVYREACARASTTTLAGWRWSLIGFPYLGGEGKVQVAVDTTLVSLVRVGGKLRLHCARQDGAAIVEVHTPNARFSWIFLVFRGAWGWWCWQLRWVVWGGQAIHLSARPFDPFRAPTFFPTPIHFPFSSQPHLNHFHFPFHSPVENVPNRPL